jgi:RimJ/RimL family protein N-acetyltransferase
MFTPIKTERLLIRRLNGDDIPGLFAYRSNPLVSKFQNWAPLTIEEAREFLAPALGLEQPTEGMWFQVGLFLQDSGKLIGDCGIHLSENAPRHAEIGISIDPDHQKNGYAMESLRAIIDYLFLCLDMHRITGSVDPRNLSSVALLEKIGMRREAHLIQSYWSKGEWADDFVFAVLNHEWVERLRAQPVRP